jgi:serine/threonine-protein kinase
MKPDPFEIVGTILDGRYRIDEVVGEGGFGVVYRAFHLGFDAAIAIKVLKVPQGLKAEEREELLATFHQEGKLLFELSKVSVTFVQVMEKGVLRRQGMPFAPYLVLEWLNGRTLDADLNERRARGQAGRSLDEVIALLDPVAEALALAHIDWKVAHRDVKPENIFLVRGTRGGMATKLLDFGIAKVMTSTGSAALNDPTLKGSGGLTPQYAAPEQWNLKYGHTGPWSDVYALALVCVELLTGKRALEGNEPGQLFGATIDPERPTPSRRGVAVSAPVEQVFLRALAVRPEQRYREMRSFWDALRAASTDRASLPVPAALTTPLPGPGALATALALAPTVPASTADAPPAGGTAQMGWHAAPAHGPAASLSGAAVRRPPGALNAGARGRGPIVLSIAGGALALAALGGGFLLFRGPSSSQESAVPAAASETPDVGPSSSAGPASEAPGTAPPPSSAGPRTAPVPAVGGALTEPSGAPAGSSAQALSAVGANDCQQRSDCKDGRKCVRGVCSYVECTENQDCFGPRVCNKIQNKCEFPRPRLPKL